MKRFVITEEEKNRIMGLYEQAQPTQPKIDLDIMKYKDALVSVFNNIANSVNSEKMCSDTPAVAKELSNSLNDLLARMTYDTKATPQQVIDELYNKYNSVFATLLINVAKPLFPKDSQVPKELMDSLSNELRAKYGDSGARLNSVIYEILSKIGAPVVPFCQVS